MREACDASALLYLMPEELTERELPGMPEPKAPKPGSMAAIKHELRLYKTLVAEEGGLVPPSVGADVLGVGRSCVDDLTKRGKLSLFVVFGRPYLSLRELESRLGSVRDRGGRPRRLAVA